MTSVAQGYAEVRDRVLDLLDSIDASTAERRVPACPEWTIRELASHQAGVATDALAGRLEGVATDPWTARQVEERADRSLTEIRAELAGTADAFDAALVAIGDSVDPRLLIDAWTHEQDLRGALGSPGGRSGPAFELVVDLLERGLATGVDQAGLGAIHYYDDVGRETLLGSSPAGIELRCSRFELARSRMGRRSVDQIASLGWFGDPEPYTAMIPMFPPASEPIGE